MNRARVPLAYKFSGWVALVVIAFGATHLIVLRGLVEPRLRAVEELRSVEIGRSFAATLIEPLLVDDFLEVDRRMELALRQSDIRYAFIVAQDGRVLSHTFDEGVPEALLHVGEDDQGPSHPLSIGGARVRDVAVPLARGHLGRLRLGVGEESVARSMQDSVKILGLMVLVFLVIAITGAVAYAASLTRPLVAIIQTFDRFRLDRRFEPHEVIRQDEIGAVGRSVNETLRRLEVSHAELSVAQGQLLDAEKLASIGVLASGVAHDVNNPLAGIRNCLTRIEAAPERLDQTLAYVKLMREATEHIESVVRGLLDFARRRPQRSDPVTLAAVIERASRLCSYRLSSSFIKVHVRVPPALWALGDEDRLTQVFVNLFLNSLDAMQDGGRLEVVGEELDEEIRLEVRDTGTGIAPEHLRLVFEPFFSTKGPSEGTGLGLPVTKMIVEEHGGRISVESSGAGTIVRIGLPKPTSGSDQMTE
ncbi:MAG: hypothetical protein HY791_31455 [Deltaproteobacteria bacterium]|nr:hypothetical protein [Deltaproteobacteria bacterium]